jgi:hypothetical protein
VSDSPDWEYADDGSYYVRDDDSSSSSGDDLADLGKRNVCHRTCFCEYVPWIVANHDADVRCTGV